MAAIGFLVTVAILFYTSFAVALPKEKQEPVRRLTEDGALIMAHYLAGLYQFHLLSLTEDFKNHYSKSFTDLPQDEEKKKLEDLFITAVKTSLNITHIYGWNKARIIFLGDEDYVVNTKSLPGGYDAAEEINPSLKAGQQIKEELNAGKGAHIKKIPQVDEPFYFDEEGQNYIIAVKFSPPKDTDGLFSEELIKEGCIECHKRIAKEPDRDKLKGAIIFEIPRK